MRDTIEDIERERQNMIRIRYHEDEGNDIKQGIYCMCECFFL